MRSAPASLRTGPRVRRLLILLVGLSLLAACSDVATTTTTATTTPTVLSVTGTHEVRDITGLSDAYMPELTAMIGNAYQAGEVSLLTGEQQLSDPRLSGLAEITILDCGTPAAGSADAITCSGPSSSWDEAGTWESGVTVHVASDGSMVTEVAGLGTGAYAHLAWTATERGSGGSFEVTGRVEGRPGTGPIVEPVGEPPPGATLITGTSDATDTGSEWHPGMTHGTQLRGGLWQAVLEASDERVSGHQFVVLHLDKTSNPIYMWGVTLLLVEPGKSWYGTFWGTITDTNGTAGTADDLHALDEVFTGVGEYAGLEFHSHAEGLADTWDMVGWIDEAD